MDTKKAVIKWQDTRAVPIEIKEADPNSMHRLEISSQATVKAEHTAPGGGGTGGEYPQNLLSEGHESYNKWFASSNNKSWVTVKMHND